MALAPHKFGETFDGKHTVFSNASDHRAESSDSLVYLLLGKPGERVSPATARQLP